MENVELLAQQKKKTKNEITERNKTKQDEKDDDLLHSRLISESEMIKEDNTNIQPELLASEKEPSSSAVVEVETNMTSGESDGGSKETGTEEILKELRKVKRQNSITHWLLAIMIALTATWQFSEVSLILKVKNKLTNPFKSFGDMFTGAQDALKHFDGNESDAALKNIQSPSLPPLKIPDLPFMDLPVLGLTDLEK
ncbi:hypothetical protein AQUCO_04000101v1 [Aquilegia coerulea]|uniref:Uncharacterized protein n=1 Tax=Aquilegia coerulea TaxID=218851 RepID=A0A2G5CR98_AQUCA|nr:hypothetical protein AQUCO_04000101v1 [Aquilegia coerulea]